MGIPKGVHLLILLVPLLVSCKGKEKPKRLALYDDILLSKSRYFDVPTPVGYTLLDAKINKKHISDIEEINNASSYSLCYAGSLSMKEAVNFYRQSMERLGWDISDLSSKGEGLLFCRKNNKSCAISVRSERTSKGSGHNKSKIHIFLQDDVSNIVKTKDINSKQLLMA